ncbi:TPA: ead/Ea22-like family protein [Enterobacter kobei]|nr:ead/Ea22-like family protein [Enterobacter kobei]
MSNIDKQALREAAEKALPAMQRLLMMPNDELFDEVLLNVDGDVDAANAFNLLTGPETVLALLDELEAKDKRIIDLEATTSHSNAGWKEAHEQEARAEAAEKRIAELEAREVKLPNPHAHLIWIQAGHAPDDYWDDVAVSHSEKDKCCDGSDRYPVYALWEIKEALSAIGINIAAAGKGE